MRLRQVEVAGGSLQFLMAKQDLNGSKVGTGFQQMPARRVAVCTASQTALEVKGLSARQPFMVPGKR